MGKKHVNEDPNKNESRAFSTEGVMHNDTIALPCGKEQWFSESEKNLQNYLRR